MNIPQNRSTYLPDFPIKILQAALILLGIIIFFYTIPVVFVGESERTVASQEALINVQTIEDGLLQYSLIDIETVVERNPSMEEEIRINTNAEWVVTSSTEMDNSLEGPIYIEVIAAPTSWSNERILRDGVSLFSADSTLSQGESVSYTHETSIPDSFEPTGVGPNEIGIHHYAVSNSGEVHFRPITYYTVHRPFSDRPRAGGLLISLFLIIGTTLTFNQSIRSMLSSPFNIYTERRWNDDLTQIAKELDHFFEEYQQFNNEESAVLEKAQYKNYNSLSEFSANLKEYNRLYEAVSNQELDNTILDTTSIRSSAAIIYWNGENEKAKQLTRLTLGLVDGLDVSVRGKSFDCTPAFGESVSTVSTDFQDLSEITTEISEFSEAKKTVEKWSQPIPHKNEKTKLSLNINGEWVEPNSLWKSIEENLQIMSIKNFKSDVDSLQKLSNITIDFRSNAFETHPLVTGAASTEVIETTKEAIRNVDIETLEQQISKSEAEIAKRELEDLFDSTDLTYSIIEPDEIEYEVKNAWNNKNYSKVLDIRDNTLEQLDTTWRPADLLELSPQQFEETLGQLYRKKGYSVTVRQLVADRGVDVIAENDHQTIAIQAKRYDPNGGGNVSGPEVRNSIGATIQFDGDICVVATSSGFTKDAKRAAIETNRMEVKLLDGKQVAKMLSKNQVPKS